MLTPGLQSHDPLSVLMCKSAETKNEKLFSSGEIYWNANHYRLSQTSYFTSLTESRQQDILQELNHKSLSLSYYIEKFGLNYGAKMILCSETTEEKSLYALFSGDEVRHRLWLEKFFQRDVIANIDFHPLLKALELCLNQGNQKSMVFTIQVILEGFGLYHYGNLKESCLNLHLKEAFSEILKDEVLHHGMGVVLTQKMPLDQDTKLQVFELTALFVRALIEAEWVLKTLNEHSGGMTSEQLIKFKHDVCWAEQIAGRTEKIKSLIKKVGYAGLAEELELKGIFKY